MGEKIVVSSTIYSMSGEEKDRPIYLESLMFSKIMGGGDVYLGESIVKDYLDGPGIRQRNFFKWAVANNYAGLPEFSVRNEYAVDVSVVAAEIPKADPAYNTIVQRAYIKDADFQDWAEQYILDNFPERLTEDWGAEYDKATHEITIQFPSDPTVIFNAGSFDVNEQFIVARYYQTIDDEESAVTTGTETTGETDASNLPDDTDFVLDSTTNTNLTSHTRNRNTLVVDSYSDSTPDNTVSDTDEDISSNHQDVETLKIKTTYVGNDGESVETTSDQVLQYVEERRYIVETVTETTETFDEGGGVTRTRTTTVTEDTLEPIWDFREDTRTVTHGKVVKLSSIFIYQIGDGNATLDALGSTPGTVSTDEFFPFIPVRLDNVSIDEEPYITNGLYSDSKTAYRRASGQQKLDTIIADIEDNESIDDIDYTYISYGVPLNVVDNSSRKYLYNFFRDLASYQTSTSADVAAYEAAIAQYEIDRQAWQDWIIAQGPGSHALRNTPPPDPPTLDKPAETNIRVHTDNPQTDSYDMRISWVSIKEEFLSGLGKPDATRNDVWLDNTLLAEWTEREGLEGSSLSDTFIEKALSLSDTEIYWQIDDNNYKKLTITGLKHRNFVYGGKSVDISGTEALADIDFSGFLVPLHYQTMKELGLVDATQMATSNAYIVINTYEIHKTGFFSSFLGFLLIIIAIVVISVVTGGVGANTIGLLGANGSVGAALGFAGTAGVVAGAVANAIAAIIVSRVLGTIATEVFGAQIGAIIASVLTFVMSGGIQGGFGNIGSAQNVMSLANVFANSYNGWVQGNIMDMQNEMLQNQKEFDAESQRIQELMSDLMGNKSLYFDPMSLTNTNNGNKPGPQSYTPETLDEFIHRTTLVGSDIVDITLSMVNNYTALQLTLPKTDIRGS